MRQMISIDPGTKVLGEAFWIGGKLEGCGVIRTEGRTLGEKISGLPTRDGGQDLAVCELMDANGLRVPANDLIAVQAVGCVYAARMAREVKLVLPRTWKGNVPKRIHHPRIRAALSPDERDILQIGLDTAPKGHHKEILDAVGIGLWALGRKV